MKFLIALILCGFLSGCVTTLTTMSPDGKVLTKIEHYGASALVLEPTKNGYRLTVAKDEVLQTVADKIDIDLIRAAMGGL